MGCSELLLPLRAFSEAWRCMLKTYAGNPVPEQPLVACLAALFCSVLSSPDGFSSWRYESDAGREHLRGLSAEQIDLWRKPLCMDPAEQYDGLRSHEDAEGELGFFWATKVGGPSHGFDFEGQCLLPLLANARHKVILVSSSEWPAHPFGRTHFRLLWTAEDEPQPRLWLEAVNEDFAAAEAEAVNRRNLHLTTFQHAIFKSEQMRIPLSMDSRLDKAMEYVAAAGSEVTIVEEKLMLRPSNGVLEASDYLSNKHDWVQMSEEMTEPSIRMLYIPSSMAQSRPE